MTLGTYIETIKKKGEIKGSKIRFATDLFIKSGLVDSTEHAMKKWLDGTRTPTRVNSAYVNEAGFIGYLNKRTEDKWPEMQEAFSKIEPELFSKDNKDANVFYKGLFSSFMEILELEPVSLCHNLPEEPFRIGREAQLGRIARIFKDNNYAILTGIGVMGKSQTALAYAHDLNKSGEWIIQHIICDDKDTLQTCIKKLEFVNLKDPKDKADDKPLELRLKALRNSSKSILIVLDNLSQPVTLSDQEILKKCGDHVKFLITSRDSLVSDMPRVVEIGELEPGELQGLYKFYRFDDVFYDGSYIDEYVDEHKDTIGKLIDLVGKNTLAVILLAKLLNGNSMKEQELYEHLETGLNLPTEEINIPKDEKEISGSIEEITHKLFDISQLSDTEKRIMKYMAIMPVMGIARGLLEELTECKPREIDLLIRRNWVINEKLKRMIRLHPVIRETMLREFAPEEYYEFMQKVSAQMDESTIDSPRWHALKKIETCYFLKVTCNPKHYHPKLGIRNEVIFNTFSPEVKKALLTLREPFKAYLDSDASEIVGQITESTER